MTYIFIIISLFLDGIISVLVNQNSYFIPHILLTTLFIIYPKFKNKRSIYDLILIVTGIVYDLLYTNLLFFHAILFFIIGKLIKHIYQNYSQKIIINIISLIIIITVYILLTSIIMTLFKTTSINISEVLDFITRSLLLNIMCLLLLRPLFKKEA